jgi:hypothetical protein
MNDNGLVTGDADSVTRELNRRGFGYTSMGKSGAGGEAGGDR